MNLIEKLLFETESLKISNEEKPFWYTSGTIGPFYINTHYLYGGEKHAIDLLSFIDNNMNNENFIDEIENKIFSFYQSNKIYKTVIDYFYKELIKIQEFNDCEYISGGERRDWFFSSIISHLSNKKNLYIYKNLNIISQGKPIKNINKSKVVHICDLITQASSFKRAWIPAIKQINGKLSLVATVVDRNENGIEILNKEGIKTFKAVTINDDFLKRSLKEKLINQKQLQQIIEFKKDPNSFGKNFLLNNKTYLINSLQDLKNKSKAERCIKENPYKLDFNTVFLGKQVK
ncbi:MAG: orotate phosphoribosyltransferase [Spirochaetes bacterium]|nr:orotate phosphoribosyltransferase [Spirochaetota bacterium]